MALEVMIFITVFLYPLLFALASVLELGNKMAKEEKERRKWKRKDMKRPKI